MVTTMAAVSVTNQQYQQFIDRISGLEARMATLQTHAEAQQEQIHAAEMLIQQLRAAVTNPTNLPSPFRAAFVKQETEGGACKALTRYCVFQCDTSTYKSRREICRTVTVDIGTDR